MCVTLTSTVMFLTMLCHAGFHARKELGISEDRGASGSSGICLRFNEKTKARRWGLKPYFRTALNRVRHVTALTLSLP